ncbi:uncharacterized protein LODBEIA_P27610 [Lodderomyces beijingensis]|uniref:SRP9 domain-containing protein n=1 Tax=Lodderomyces beijingensis TaxID=1775926 RepID=A0ABP0ZQQ3_9ASCO
MPRIKSLDDFLELSSDLLANFPSTTLSITYTNIAKKIKSKSAKADSKDTKSQSTKTKHGPTSTHAVYIKFYEPHTGKCLKYKTIKQKELSRILNMIGPQGISNSVGLASLMTNCKFEPVVEPVVSVAEDIKVDEVATSKEGTPLPGKEETPQPSSSSNKKKNKKKKKN